MTTPADPSPAGSAQVPEKPSVDGLEDKWAPVWEAQGTYRFDRARALELPREQVYSIDTPPPTASGSLHVGHVFSYTHTDCMARYQRMPASRCSTRWAGTTTACPPRSGCRTTTACAATRPCPTPPTTSRVTTATPAKDVKDASKQEAISRRNFIELCERAHRRGRGGRSRRCGGGWACPSTGASPTRPSTARPSASAAGLPAQPRTGAGLPGRGAHAVGRHLPHGRGAGRARGPRAAPGLPPRRRSPPPPTRPHA
jgi:hypothetical protein